MVCFTQFACRMNLMKEQLCLFPVFYVCQDRFVVKASVGAFDLKQQGSSTARSSVSAYLKSPRQSVQWESAIECPTTHSQPTQTHTHFCQCRGDSHGLQLCQKWTQYLRGQGFSVFMKNSGNKKKCKWQWKKCCHEFWINMTNPSTMNLLCALCFLLSQWWWFIKVLLLISANGKKKCPAFGSYILCRMLRTLNKLILHCII